MCTVITKTQKPHIAKADIVVYKRAYHTYHSGDSSCESMYLGHSYNVDELYITEMTLVEDGGPSDHIESAYLNELGKRAIFVKEGFHAYASYDRMSNGYRGNADKCEFVIPKGAFYYQNKVGNIVSNQIIFKHFL